MGLDTHVFSWEEGAVCKNIANHFYPISIIEKEKILEKCKDIGIDAITTIASDVAVITVNYVAENLGLISNPVEFSEITTNKYLMRTALKACGVPCPGFVKLLPGDYQEKCSLSLPLIVKPTDRSGSRGVSKSRLFLII